MSRSPDDVVPPERPSGNGSASLGRGLFVLLLVASLALAAYVLIRHVRGIPGRLGRTLTEKAVGKKEQQIDLTALVTQVRELNRLETASMRVVHLSKINQSYGMVPNSISGDSITFMAVGDVIAGVNLSSLDRGDISRGGGGEIVLRLPPAEVLVTRVDNQQSRVVERQTGMLRRPDVHLESRARARAEQGIRSEALKKGILRLADESAEKKLADFLHTLGFERVRFERESRARTTTRG